MPSAEDKSKKWEIPFEPLDGRFVRLEPFVPELKADVHAAIDCDPDTWAIMPVNPTGEGFEKYWSAACSARLDERMVYAIRQRSDARVVGISTYYMALARHRGVEIGTTFLHPDVRGGFVNPEAKMLMLSHAFAGGAVRVQFRVDSRNQRSQAAMAKLGAIREGMLRKDLLTWTGYIRDTVVFSILDHEWPAVKLQLERRLAKYS
jgi:RimJ/RimL family protein N-acetyltransferase